MITPKALAPAFLARGYPGPVAQILVFTETLVLQCLAAAHLPTTVLSDPITNHKLLVIGS